MLVSRWSGSPNNGLKWLQVWERLKSGIRSQLIVTLFLIGYCINICQTPSMKLTLQWGQRTPSSNIPHSWKDSHRLSNCAVEDKTRKSMALCELGPGIGTGGDGVSMTPRGMEWSGWVLSALYKATVERLWKLWNVGITCSLNYESRWCIA